MIDFIISINKISLVAFLLTLGYLIYEIYLLKKEQKRKKMPSIPQFKEGLAPAIKGTTIVVSKKDDEVKRTKKDSKILTILIIFLFFFSILSFVGFFYKSDFRKENNSQITVTPKIIEKIVDSDGIFIYDENYKLFDEDDLNKLASGSTIIIGVKTVPQVDIDKARIRVNKNYWQLSDETKSFDEKNQIFYLNYKVSSDEEKLKIEAQLHSKTEGWLGE